MEYHKAIHVKEGDNLLMYAISNGLINTGNEILKRMNGKVLSQVNKYNDNTLFTAIGKGRFDLIDSIISREDVDINHIKDGSNLLMLLMNLSRWDLVEKLFKRKDLDLNHLRIKGLNLEQILINRKQGHLINLIR